jgi:hypothetical protein
LYNGDLCYGYRNPDQGTERSGAGIANSTLPVIDPAEADVVRLAYDLYISGEHSHASVAETLNRAGYRIVSKLHPDGYPFTKDTVTAMLRNPFYIGQVRCREALVPGRHGPIISQDLYDRVQTIHARKDKAGRRGSTIGRRHTYVAAGLVRCTCCRQILRGNAHNGHQLFYQDKSPERGIPCTAIRRSIDGPSVDAALFERVTRLILPDDWREKVLSDLADENEANKVADRREALDRQLEQAQRFLLDGYITESQFREKRAQFEAEKATLQAPPRWWTWNEPRTCWRIRANCGRMPIPRTGATWPAPSSTRCGWILTGGASSPCK